MMHTQNGSEFKADVRQILYLENIKHVHGRPYHPQSQGMVENFNWYIKKYLILEYLTCRKEEFSLQIQIDRFVYGYNTRVHSVTKKTPRDVLFSTNKNTLEEVRYNIELL